SCHHLLPSRISSLPPSVLSCHPAEYEIKDECCPKCQPGTHVKKDCTEFMSTSCQTCSNGTFMSQITGLKYCLPCTNCDTGSGVKVKRSCTKTLDAICEPLEGFYCIDTKEDSCVAAEKHSECKPGQYIITKGTASKDTLCSDCSHGTFSDGTLTSCRPQTKCDAENHLIKPGTAAADAECVGNGSLTAAMISVFLLLILGVALFFFLYRKKYLSDRNVSLS
uniref:TNFR-Cys domain-containing protein n=1 Tax=Echeneis naucrates TaxID=173247 RepID=A0A665X8M4_ECHNA